MSKTKKPQTREDRLRAALRENLKRRKVQARARTGGHATSAPQQPGDGGDGPDFRRNPGRE